jgi:ABC-type sugar transport system ATPase subunit
MTSHSVKQVTQTLSGGNQQKVVLAKWLLVRPKVLIVDEPTRGIDVGAKAEVHDLLRELARNGTAVLVISSELPEVLAVADRILVMHEGRITGELSGGEATEEKILRYASMSVAA